MLASFGIIVPTTLFKVMAVRLNAPELNIETVWKLEKEDIISIYIGDGALVKKKVGKCSFGFTSL